MFIFVWTIGQSISFENLSTYVILCAEFIFFIGFIPRHQHPMYMTLGHDPDVYPVLSACTCFIILNVILFLLGPYCFWMHEIVP